VVRSYDANGNQIQAGPDVFSYDSQNRLVSATVAGVTAEYGYNHLHQRVTKTLNGHTRLMLYDQAGNLLSEVDSATGQTLAEYVWLDGAPLVYIEAGNTYQVHVDHLGTPQVLTDAGGQVAWEAHYTPFGRASVISQGPTFNLRFPGQYFDAGTGLHYNWHRYYDPAIGRYITSDPIGLAGGLNTYGYVGGNPLGNVDILGLATRSEVRRKWDRKYGPRQPGKGGRLGVFGCIVGCVGYSDGDSEAQASMSMTIGGGISLCSPKKELKKTESCEVEKQNENCGVYDPNCDSSLGFGAGPGGRAGVIVSYSASSDGSTCVYIGPHAGYPSPVWNLGAISE